MANSIYNAFVESGSPLVTQSNRVGPIRQHDRYYLLREINYPIPIVLIEAGFMSNASELEYIINNMPEIAEAIAAGLVDFLR